MLKKIKSSIGIFYSNFEISDLKDIIINFLKSDEPKVFYGYSLILLSKSNPLIKKPC